MIMIHRQYYDYDDSYDNNNNNDIFDNHYNITIITNNYR